MVKETSRGKVYVLEENKLLRVKVSLEYIILLKSVINFNNTEINMMCTLSIAR